MLNYKCSEFLIKWLKQNTFFQTYEFSRNYQKFFQTYFFQKIFKLKFFQTYFFQKFFQTYEFSRNYLGTFARYKIRRFRSSAGTFSAFGHAGKVNIGPPLSLPPKQIY